MLLHEQEVPQQITVDLFRRWHRMTIWPREGSMSGAGHRAGNGVAGSILSSGVGTGAQFTSASGSGVFSRGHVV